MSQPPPQDTESPFYIKTSHSRPDRFLNYQISDGNDRSGPTIFFCHGAGGNKNQWRNQWKSLAKAGHRLVAWDCFGHGNSVQPHVWRAYAGAALVEDYLRILDLFAGDRAILVAHSYGARLTLAALLTLQEQRRLSRIKAAVLLGVPSPTTPLSLGPLLALPSFLLERLRPRLSAAFRRLAWHPDADPALIAAEEEATRRNSLFMTKALIAQAVLPDPAALARLDLPVHIIVGDSDRLTPPEHGLTLQRLLPRAQLHTVARCGHQIMLERPEAVTRLLESVIAEVQQ